MGKIILHDYYMCKKCRTPVALSESLTHVRVDTGTAFLWLFDTAFNLRVDDPERHYLAGQNKVSDVYCHKLECGEKLGFKYIEIGATEHIAKNNEVSLYMEKLLNKKGDKVVEALETLPEHPDDKRFEMAEYESEPEDIPKPEDFVEPPEFSASWQPAEPPRSQEGWEPADPPRGAEPAGTSGSGAAELSRAGTSGSGAAKPAQNAQLAENP